MQERIDRFRQIEKDIRDRQRVSVFCEGKYVLKHPLLFLFKPKLKLSLNGKRNRVDGDLMFLGRRQKLQLIKFRDDWMVFQFDIDIVKVDMVIQFYRRDAFDAFFDTPIGHIRFTGRYTGS